MSVSRIGASFGFRFVVLAALLGGVSALAEEETVQSGEENKVLEEMIITAGPKSGDPVDLDAQYAEQMRERILRDQERLRILREEEEEWRSAASATVEEPGRMQWGYNPQDEMKMRRDSSLFDDVQRDTVKPATVFKVGF